MVWLKVLIVSSALAGPAIDPKDLAPTYLESQTELEDYLERNEASLPPDKGTPYADLKRLTESTFSLVWKSDGKMTANGSAFFITKDGYFVTTHHGYSKCLEIQGRDKAEEHSASISCNNINNDGVRESFVAEYSGKEYPTRIVSHIMEAPLSHRLAKFPPATDIPSLEGTPFDQASSSDLIIGKVDLPPGLSVTPVSLPLDSTTVGNQLLSVEGARPPERVYAVGFPGNDLRVSAGCITLNFFGEGTADDVRLGMISAKFHWPRLKTEQDKGPAAKTFPRHNLHLDAQSGFSGGPVLDAYGNLRGILVAANKDASMILSVNQVIGRFFTAQRIPKPLITLDLDQTYYLKRSTGIKEPEYGHSSSYLPLKGKLDKALLGNPSDGIYTSYKELLERVDLDPTVSHPAPNTTETAFGTNAAQPPDEILATIPDFFEEAYREIRRSKNVFGGPNCWNTALVFNDLTYPVKHTTSLEIVEKLGEEYRLAPLPLQRGDIVSVWSYWLYPRGSVRSGHFQLEHSAVYLQDKWFFGKQTTIANSGYEVTTFGKQFYGYDTLMLHDITTDRSKGLRGNPADFFVYTVHRKK